MIFWREIFHEVFREIFLKYFKNFTTPDECRLYSSLSKPVQSKYLLLCMNSALEVSLNDMRYINSRFTYLLTYLHYVFSTNFIYLNHVFKVLSHFIMKIKNFVKYFKEGVLKYFFIVHPYVYGTRISK